MYQTEIEHSGEITRAYTRIHPNSKVVEFLGNMCSAPDTYELLSSSALVGESAQMKEVYRLIKRVSGGDSTVLIQGESGTGKELVARAIHMNSERKSRPLVAVNCAALTESLSESELFGHEKGAFTGASAQTRGLIEHAHEGTFLMDEIGELVPSIQAKLLRVLQERAVMRVGGRTVIPVNVRLIAATNKNLLEEVRKGAFRSDLYYRVNVVSINLPPLRERREDIPLLAGHFLGKHSKRCRRSIKGFSAEAERTLLNYDWPGNVRELANVIERAVLLGNDAFVRPEDFPETLHVSNSGQQPSGYRESMAQSRKEALLEAIKQSDGNLTEAARLLGVHRNYLYRLMRALGLRQAGGKAEAVSG